MFDLCDMFIDYEITPTGPIDNVNIDDKYSDHDVLMEMDHYVEGNGSKSYV